MTEADFAKQRFLEAKRAFDSHRKTQEAIKEANEAKDRGERLAYLGTQWLYYLEIAKSRAESEGRQPGEALEKEIREAKGSIREAIEDRERAEIEERQALEDLTITSEELLEATVEQRVEGLKLQFETRKLQATLSAAVILGTATIAGLLLPPNPGYTYVLWAAYAAFLMSLYGSLSDMQRISIYVENVLISGSTEAEDGWREKVARWMLKINRRLLSFGVLLFVVFVTLNLT